MTVLPDVLEPELSVIFCGTAAGTTSAHKLRAYSSDRLLISSFNKTLTSAGEFRL